MANLIFVSILYIYIYGSSYIYIYTNDVGENKLCFDGRTDANTNIHLDIEGEK